ncbi:unnamed protein product [Lampetra fluviatilis]
MFGCGLRGDGVDAPARRQSALTSNGECSTAVGCPRQAKDAPPHCPVDMRRVESSFVTFAERQRHERTSHERTSRALE